MLVHDTPSTALLSAERLLAHLPGVIFQLHRDRNGRLQFRYLEGGGSILERLDRVRLGEDAAPVIQTLAGEHWPAIETAIERSARWLVPLSTRFRIVHPQHRLCWVGVSALPERNVDGVTWNGLMMDVTGQVAHEQRLEKRCHTDLLTGLANRRRLMMELKRRAQQSREEATPLSVMMIDVDFFKRFNDRHGHARGDEILRSLAQQTQQLLRASDLMARLGGEEFVVVAPRTPLSHCRCIADRVRDAIARLDLGTGVGEVTVSIGVAEYRPDEALTTLLKRADQALYRAKDTGRDCVYPIA
ncbi:GGDEF domain-containing protein [Vreelandella malpeensis]|uniref:diguanylate cyclase n=1 Tax=Vreelandella malpeensis TaxID=1172368 RepID=A0ABS8DWX4_9GAMM|nr:GGDEF domain-containing protein [Halomonas malpeensis]MCB8890345.1 diguanylate cyclase [Halomonas malpeensis]